MGRTNVEWHVRWRYRIWRQTHLAHKARQVCMCNVVIKDKAVSSVVWHSNNHVTTLHYFCSVHRTSLDGITNLSLQRMQKYEQASPCYVWEALADHCLWRGAPSQLVTLQPTWLKGRMQHALHTSQNKYSDNRHSQNWKCSSLNVHFFQVFSPVLQSYFFIILTEVQSVSALYVHSFAPGEVSALRMIPAIPAGHHISYHHFQKSEMICMTGQDLGLKSAYSYLNWRGHCIFKRFHMCMKENACAKIWANSKWTFKFRRGGPKTRPACTCCNMCRNLLPPPPPLTRAKPQSEASDIK